MSKFIDFLRGRGRHLVSKHMPAEYQDRLEWDEYIRQINTQSLELDDSHPHPFITGDKRKAMSVPMDNFECTLRPEAMLDMMENECPNCESKVPENAIKCPRCGENFQETEFEGTRFLDQFEEYPCLRHYLPQKDCPHVVRVMAVALLRWKGRNAAYMQRSFETLGWICYNTDKTRMFIEGIIESNYKFSCERLRNAGLCASMTKLNGYCPHYDGKKNHEEDLSKRFEIDSESEDEVPGEEEEEEEEEEEDDDGEGYDCLDEDDPKVKEALDYFTDVPCLRTSLLSGHPSPFMKLQAMGYLRKELKRGLAQVRSICYQLGWQDFTPGVIDFSCSSISEKGLCSNVPCINSRKAKVN